ncbi:unnamed protein product [Durusdinium trenchii]|uniref:Aspartyl/asparaginy/proline hydroxylase domain-containing protein n=1 Tax=Durusdinium trenchii TaxID=1381693 RepID=A0ABP0MYK8_9DINO
MFRMLLCLWIVAVSASDLDRSADDALIEELQSLMGQEQWWPKGGNAKLPRKTWERWKQCQQPGFPSLLRDNRTRTSVRAAHVKVMEWLVRHHRDHPRRKQLADSIGQRLVHLGLVTHPYQWAEVLNEQLSSFPVLDPHTDPIPWPGVAKALQWLETNYTLLLSAFHGAAKHHRFREHPEGLHLTGLWETAYISRERCNRKSYPEVCHLLEVIDEIWPKVDEAEAMEAVLEARFARLHPGTAVVEHTADTNQRIKIHCGIENPSNVTMFIGHAQVCWQPGRCYLVDDSYAHHISSEDSDQPRTILELKVAHPDLVWADYLDEEDGTLVPKRSGGRSEL